MSTEKTLAAAVRAYLDSDDQDRVAEFDAMESALVAHETATQMPSAAREEFRDEYDVPRTRDASAPRGVPCRLGTCPSCDAKYPAAPSSGVPSDEDRSRALEAWNEPDSVQRITKLIGDVRRETIEACVAWVDAEEGHGCADALAIHMAPLVTPKGGAS